MDDTEGMVNVKREISFEGDISLELKQDQLRVEREARAEQSRRHSKVGRVLQFLIYCI